MFEPSVTEKFNSVLGVRDARTLRNNRMRRGDATGRRRTRTAGRIVRRGTGGLEALILDASGRPGGKDPLLVFGFEEGARMFLWAHALEPGWGVRRTSTGELVSLLSGPCAPCAGLCAAPR
jgi:hypothetical protein